MTNFCVAWMILTSTICFGQEIKVASFNLESGDASIDFLANQICEMSNEVDIWGFQEVDPTWAEIIADELEATTGHEYSYLLGKSGGYDRLAIVYKLSKYRLVSYIELDDINVSGKVRAPLVAEFEDINNGTHFLFMNNHLYRSNARFRHTQAEKLNQWANKQRQPVIAVGDYNFDWEVNGKGYDRGFEHMTSAGVFQWVQPNPLQQTHCSGRYNTILDFIFVSGIAKGWKSTSRIVAKGRERCRDDFERSDHLPVIASIMAEAPY